MLVRRYRINPLNAELIPICYFLVLLGAHHILHISRIKVNVAKFLVKKQVTLYNNSHYVVRKMKSRLLEKRS
jgi:hypothetical protein